MKYLLRKKKLKTRQNKLPTAYSTKPILQTGIAAIHLIYKPSKFVNDNTFKLPDPACN